MCIWCLRDDEFFDDEWNEMMEERVQDRLSGGSLMNKVKSFFSGAESDEHLSSEKD